jgi:hypothetical protein
VSDAGAVEYRREGRAWLRGCLGRDTVERLRAVASAGATPGRRLRVDDIHLALDGLRQAARPSGPAPRIVRVVGFGKGGERNWGVPWHQDRVIAVRDRKEVAGYGNWSRKADVWHCEPPLDLLHRMALLRVFLDPVGPENGGMEFALGSHREGRVGDSVAADVAARYPLETEIAEPGDVMLLHMLTLHRSSPSQMGAARRVLRVDVAQFDLPSPLDWANRAALSHR